MISAAPATAGDTVPGKWVEVQTENFVVLSNAGTKQAVRIAEHFERIRKVFIPTFRGLDEISTPPLVIFAAADNRSMKRLLPSFWESRGRSRPAGVFRRTATAVNIVVRADLVGGDGFDLVYHEYFHYLAHLTRKPVPVWLNEGMADFWSNTRLTRDANEIGHPDLYYLELLREGFLLPLDVLVSVDHASPHYHRRGKSGHLYAQSWALIHYLLLGDETGERRRQLAECLRLVGEGVDSLEAARQAFGDLKELHADLRRYVRGRLFRYIKQPLTERVTIDRSAAREVSTGEIAARIARFLLEGRRVNEAKELSALALKEAPHVPATHEASGLLHVLLGEYPQATTAFERALELGATGPLAHYGTGVLKFREDRSPARSRPKIPNPLQSMCYGSSGAVYFSASRPRRHLHTQ